MLAFLFYSVDCKDGGKDGRRGMTTRSYGGGLREARRGESQTQLSPSRTALTKDVVASTLSRMNKRHELLDSPRSKNSRWPGDDADVPMPNWGVLLHEEIYKQELEAKAEITRRYNAFLKKPLRVAAGGKGPADEGLGGDGSGSGALGGDEDGEPQLALTDVPATTASVKNGAEDDDVDPLSAGDGEAVGKGHTGGSTRKLGAPSSRRSTHRESKT